MTETAPRNVAFLTLLLICGGAVGADPGFPRVTLGALTFEGTAGESHPGVAVFRGIPFARPPLAELRWEAPRQLEPQSGVRAATQFSPACWQGDSNTVWYHEVAKAFGTVKIGFGEPKISEDCLYLNVWTPALAPRELLPVMVWIHGGGNRDGYSYEPNYRGEGLAAQGNVVVVSIAYRLNVFGFLQYPQTSAGHPPNATVALLDQVAALKWVRQSIRSFGGDPENVTIFGESAGASDIGYLLTSRTAAPLFRRAISQSGGFQMLDRYGAREAQADAGEFVAELGARFPHLPPRDLSAGDVMEQSKALRADRLFRPVVDGNLIETPPSDAYRVKGIHHDLLIGSNEDEWYMYVGPSRSELEEELQKLPVSARPALRARAEREPDLRHGHDKASTFVNMVCPAYRMAAAVDVSRGAWVYRFTRVRSGPGGRTLGSYHGAEIPYIFDSHDQWLPTDDVDRSLTRQMIRYWTNFARTGDPNDSDLAAWPRYDPNLPRVMILGDAIHAAEAPDVELCEKLGPMLYDIRDDLGGN